MYSHRFLGLLSVAVLGLSACSTTVFPDVIEDDQVRIEGQITADDSSASVKTQKIVRPMPSEGAVLTADNQNIAYEDDEEIKPDENIVNMAEADEDVVTPAKTVPVIKEKETPVYAEAEVNKVIENPVVEDVKTEEMAFAETNDEQPSISYRAETIYFANGSAVVDASYNKSLRRIVKEAKDNNAKVKVIGFASSRTRNTDAMSHKLANFKVSMERAQNVAQALRRTGLKSEDIEVEALSDSAPVYLEVMPEGERLNRRAEIYITY